MVPVKVKIFQGMGVQAIGELEDEINRWIESTSAGTLFEIIRTETAMCQITYSAGGQGDRAAIITVWYVD